MNQKFQGRAAQRLPSKTAVYGFTALLSIWTVGFASSAAAAPFTLVWKGVFDTFNLTGADPGGAFTATFTVDNGGASTNLQTWGASDFISFTAQSGSYSFTDITLMAFGFTTDATGAPSALDFSIDGIDTIGSSVTAQWISFPHAFSTLIVFGGTPDRGASYGALSNEPLDAADFANMTVTPVPEPGTALLLGFGLVGLGVRRKAQQ